METLCFIQTGFAFIFSISYRRSTDLRHWILLFLGGDTTKPSGKLNPNDNSDAATKNLDLVAKVRARIAQFFEQELKACAKAWRTFRSYSRFLPPCFISP